MACLTPYQLKSGEKVPCGKCTPCRTVHAAAWGFRLMQEFKSSANGYFITLTYDTDNVPIDGKGRLTLSPRNASSISAFIKRLRKHSQLHLARLHKAGIIPNESSPLSQKIKYFGVGEYGGKTQRPHYHVIIFNVLIEDVLKAWSINGKAIGTIYVGDITTASVGYTLKYICKPKTVPMYKGDVRTPEYRLMSKGIGLSYITDNMKRWHNEDHLNRLYCQHPDGFKISMPRYYRERIYEVQLLHEISKYQQDKMVDATIKLIYELGDDYYRTIKNYQNHDNYVKAKKSTTEKCVI